MIVAETLNASHRFLHSFGHPLGAGVVDGGAIVASLPCD